MSYSTKKAFSLWTVIPYLDALEKIDVLETEEHHSAQTG